jgi:serine/threonine-protein kinase
MAMASGEETQQLHTGDFVDPWRGLAVPESGDDLAGVTLNDTYAVERPLGEGGMGRVYLARHKRIQQKRVAVKVLHSEFAGRDEVLARFQREAEAAAAISHPNVVTVLDIDVTPRGMPYLVTEYLEGTDLSDYLKEVKRLDVVDALSIVRQLCRGLAAAHARGVIHRDLKPANVFLVGDFSQGAPRRLFAKILDFGLSRFNPNEGEQSLTKTGYIMGTPSYMAPEQARGRRVDQRADVYGLGTILYTVLTGRTPFDEETPQATLLAVLNDEPPRPRSLVPTIPPHVELIIERAMAKEPDARYQDMAELERALDALPGAAAASDQSLQPTIVEAPVTGAKRAQPPAASDADIRAARPRLLLAILSAALLLIGAAVVAISGVELATGYTFDRVELGLIVLAIAGSSLTPAVLWLLHIRKRVWDNSSRVLQLLGQVRAAVLAGVVSYGLLVLGFHVIDDFLVRFLARPDLPAVGASWTGWNLLLPAAALVTAVAVAWRRRLAVTLQPGFGRLVIVWLITALAFAIVTGIVRFGLVWRAAAGS